MTVPGNSFNPGTRHTCAGVLLLWGSVLDASDDDGHVDKSNVNPAMGGGTFILLNGVNNILVPSMTATVPVSCGGVRGEAQVVRV